MKQRIMSIIGLIVYYVFAYLAYNYVFLTIMGGVEQMNFTGGTFRHIIRVLFETVLIQNALGMVLFATIIVYELIMIALKR